MFENLIQPEDKPKFNKPGQFVNNPIICSEAYNYLLNNIYVMAFHEVEEIVDGNYKKIFKDLDENVGDVKFLFKHEKVLRALIKTLQKNTTEITTLVKRNMNKMTYDYLTVDILNDDTDKRRLPYHDELMRIVNHDVYTYVESLNFQDGMPLMISCCLSYGDKYNIDIMRANCALISSLEPLDTDNLKKLYKRIFPSMSKLLEIVMTDIYTVEVLSNMRPTSIDNYQIIGDVVMELLEEMPIDKICIVLKNYTNAIKLGALTTRSSFSKGIAVEDFPNISKAMTDLRETELIFVP